MEKCCFVCGENFELKYGRPSSSKVPLFKETINKEFTSKLSTSDNQKVIISDILKSLNLLDDRLSNLAKANAFVCKKCARKVVNCGSLFKELKSLLALSRKNKTRGDALAGSKRSLLPSSPSGFTPEKKRTSCNVNRFRESHSFTSRKALFDLEKTCPKKQDIEDVLSNLMCLPIDAEGEAKNNCTVKVRKNNLLQISLQMCCLHLHGFYVSALNN